MAVSAVSDWRAKYLDVAAASGLTSKNIYGGLHRKDYILETTGNGVAIFDYDSDGNDDLFFANGTILNSKPGEGGRPQLYHNVGNGHFTEVAAKAGVTHMGLAQGGCVGDYDSD